MTHVPDIKRPVLGKPVVFDSDSRFLSATIDPQANMAYLATPDMLYVADLSRNKPRPEPLVPLEASDQLGWMRFDAKNKRLLLTDSEFGRLYAIELAGETPRVRMLTDGLGWAADLKIDLKTGAFYIADSKGKKIWRLKCETDRCGKPQVFARSSEFVTPRNLEVDTDGTLWVSDPQARKIFAIDGKGAIRRTISSLVP